MFFFYLRDKIGVGKHEYVRLKNGGLARVGFVDKRIEVIQRFSAGVFKSLPILRNFTRCDRNSLYLMSDADRKDIGRALYKAARSGNSLKRVHS